ncbi:MAG: DUF4956 domain-containing protein [Oscillospiraceae bacterium]
MTFNDIFKSDFLDNMTSVSITDMVIVMALAFAIGILIFLTYKRTFSGVMYSANFGATLIALCMITAFVILAVTSNVVLSLGMVGALSIVRFRAAIKEPLDIAFLFWSIAAGIVLAAGMIPLAVFGSAVIAVIMLVFVNRKAIGAPYILIVSCADKTAEHTMMENLSGNTEKHVVKSKSVSAGGIELTVEVRLKDDDTDFVNTVSALPGVTSAVLVSYNGDYMS